METPDNFLGIPEVGLAEAEIIILPVPFEETTSYGRGTAAGPAAIIKASQQIELYDPKIGDEIQNLVKIATAPPIAAERKAITSAASRWADKFLVSLGGEHSITPELIKPFLKKYPDLSILQIDAHTDMRDEWGGSKNSHACAMRRVQELGVKTIVQVGIRNTAKEEQRYLNNENIFWGDKYNLKKIMTKLTDNVYLTFDVDGLDASAMPATGTPEPGGLSYNQALEIIGAATREKNIVAADFVELAPIKNMHAYDFIVAKLVYYLISYRYVKN